MKEEKEKEDREGENLNEKSAGRKGIQEDHR